MVFYIFYVIIIDFDGILFLTTDEKVLLLNQENVSYCRFHIS